MAPPPHPLNLFYRSLPGWPSEDVVRRPIDHSNRKEAENIRTVFLIVKLPRAPNPFLPPPPPSDPTQLHWSIRWEVTIHMGHVYERIVHIERATLFLEHLTNWGPLTKIHHIGSEPMTLRIPIADMTAVQRLQLERIALPQPVRDPDGVWSCQHWTTDVLTRATVAEYDAQGYLVHPPLIAIQQKEHALWRARNLRADQMMCVHKAPLLLSSLSFESST